MNDYKGPVAKTGIKAGVHRGVPEAEYHSLNLCSSSRLRTLLSQTPLHLKHELDTRDVGSSAMVLGSALHTLVLQGQDAFQAGFAVGGPINPKTGAPYGPDTKAFSEWAMAQGKPCITYTQFADIEAMAASVWRHPGASKLLRACRDRELTLFECLHGTWTKARLDAHSQELATIVDLKTTARGAGPAAFRRALVDNGYGLQACLYEAMAAKCGLATGSFVFIVIESVLPHATAVYRIANSSLMQYEQLLPRLLEKYRQCEVSGEWHGWPDDVQEIDLPAWESNELERAINRPSEIREEEVRVA